MKPSIHFRALRATDVDDFIKRTGYCPTAQFGGVVAYTLHPTMSGPPREQVMGVVGLDNWTHSCAWAHWWIRHPRCILPLWREVCSYLAQHGRSKVIGSTPSDNVAALRMIFGRLGFREIARIRHGWCDGVDIVLSEYLINEQECDASGSAGDATGRSSAERATGDGGEVAREECCSAA